MNFLKLVMIIGFFFQGSSLWAQSENMVDINDPTHLVRQGKIFTVRIVPGDKQTSFYIVGNKVADIQFNQLSVDATILGPNGTTQKLELFKKKDHFVHNGKLDTDTKIEMKIQQPKANKTEKLELRLKKTP